MILQGNQGQTGKQLGQNITAGFGETSDLLLTELQPRYYEQAYRGLTYMASNSAATAFSVQGTAAATGFILSNPAGSGKNLSIIDIIFQYTVATAGAAVAVVYAGTSPLSTAVVHTTPLTVVGSIISATAGQGKADSAATIVIAAPALVPIRIIQAAATTGAAAVVLPYVKDEVAGAIIVPPGCFIAIQGTAAIAGGMASMTWNEVAS